MTPSTLSDPSALAGRTPVVVATLAHATNDAYAAFLPALLPLYALRLGLDGAALAGLVAIFAISGSLPGPALGLLADRVGARRVTAASVLLSAVLMSLLAVAPNPAWLYPLTALAGLGIAAIHPSGSTLARQGGLTPELAVALFSAGGMLGYAAGPQLLNAARTWADDWMLPVLVTPGLLAALATLAFLPQDAAPRRAGTAPRFAWSLIAGPVGLVTLAAAFAFLPASAMLNGLPLLLAERHGLDPADPVLGRTISLYSLASAAGGIGVGLLVSRLRRRLLLGLVLAGSVPASLSVLLMAPSEPLFLAALLLAGMLGYASTPLLVVAAQDLVPDARAAASGMVFGLAAALTGALYFGLGLVQARYGAETALMLAFSAPLLALPLVLPVMGQGGGPDPGRGGEDRVINDLCRCASASSGNSLD